MARTPKPWYRTSHRKWYVRIDGRQIPLGTTKAEATAAFHQLMAGRPDGRKAVARLTVVEMLDLWLDAWQAKVRPKTWKTYAGHCQDFAGFAGKVLAADLRPRHVTAWLKLKPRWNQSTQGQAVTTLKIASRWAAREGWIDRDYLQAMPAPGIKAREAATADQLASLRQACRLESARDILDFMEATGCRPGEARSLEAVGIDWQAGTAFVVGKRGRRLLVLPKAIMPLLRRLADRWPEGPIFRNAWGNPWTDNGLGKYFYRARHRAGIAGPVVPYSCRGIFATGKIKAGVDAGLVAKLLGHSSLQPLHKHYHHPDLETLRKAADQPAGKTSGKPAGRGCKSGRS